MRNRSLQVLFAATLLAVVGAPAAWSPALAQVGGGTGIQPQLGVPYRVVDGMTLVMDVFSPRGSGPFPAVELIHGGGFTGGTPQFMQGLARFLAQNGFVAFNIEYRLAPQFPYPAAVQDAEAAVRYIRQHAGQYHVDPRRIAAFGASAGGSIAASLATEPHGPLDGGDRVAALVTWSSVFDFRPILNQSNNAPAHEYVFGNGGGASTGSSTKAAEASPVTHLTCDDPPAFVANSLTDRVPLNQADLWVAALKAKNIPNELLTPPQGHAVQYSAVARAPTLAFLTHWLKEAPVSTRCQAATPTSPTTPTGSSGNGHPSGNGRGGGVSTGVVILIAAGVVLLLALLAVVGPLARRVRR